MSDEIPSIHLGPDELPLMVLVVTTSGVHAEPMPILGTLDWDGQAKAGRTIAGAIRRAADRLEAEIGLVDAVKEAMDP